MGSASASNPREWRAQCAPVLDVLELPVFVVGRGGVTACANDAWMRAFGAPRAVPWGVLAVALEGDRDRIRRTLEFALARNHGAEIEFEAERSNGSRVVLRCSASHIRLQDDDSDALVCVCWDVTDQRGNEERLAFMAGHDPLTGLSNRRAFEEALARAVSRSTRGWRAALLLLDLDHLKDFNDARGHLEGDQALINLGLLLRKHVRSGDLPARVGGDEFAVLLEDAGIEDAREIAERVRIAASSKEFVPGAREHRLGVSAGIAVVEAGVDARTLLDRVDAALYVAKEAGRNRLVEWTPDISMTGLPERLASRVRSAFAEDGFYLLYQPVVRLADHSVAYFESLLRMRGDVEGQPTTPGEFLPVVDRLGLMPRLTRRVVELALWELAATPSASISMNLSASDLGDEGLLDDVVDLVRGAESAQGRLLFEVSEPTLLANLAGGRAWMDRLSNTCCSFVLDDFGTGVGMFVLLREPHIAQVKLSRAVMRAVTEQESNRTFVGALRELIESQGKTAVAGFIETDELLRDVTEAGFAWGQGYRLQEPVADLASLMARFRGNGESRQG